MKKTNIGVQLMPLVFAICSVVFFALGSKMYTAACMVLSILFAFVIIGETLKEKP